MAPHRSSSSAASRLRTVRLKLVHAWKEQERTHQRMDRICLATPWFRATWVAFFLLRLVLFVFLSGLSIGYWFMSSAVFAATRTAYDLPGPSAMLVISGLVGIGAAVAGVHLAQMIRCSFQHKRLAFRHPALPRRSLRTTDALRSTRFALLQSHVYALFTSVFGSRGLLGIEHPYFFQLLVVREGLEIASQGYQTYSSSRLVPRRWLNTFAVALLVLNCWSTLLVDAVGPKSLAKQRVLCLAVDIVLDFAWSVAIPVWLLTPYIAAYDATVKAFPDRRQVDFVWMLSFETEIQQLCLTSALDFVSSMMPFVSMLASARTIARLVDEQRVAVHPDKPLRAPRGSQKRVLGSAAELTALSPVTVTALPRSASKLQSSRSHTQLADKSYASSSRQANCHRVVFFLLGIAILCVHTYAVVVANQLSADAGCLVQMQPWFTSVYACAYAHLNCYAGRTGDPRERAASGLSNADDIAQRLAAFEPRTLLYLVVSHAPTLAMPAIVMRFPNLRLLHIYNSTITDWPPTVAFTTESHAKLRQLSLVRTNVSALPAGLVQDAPFVFVDLVATNLTTLPDSVSANWRALEYFTMEHGQLQALPPALAAMPALERLSVCGNKIEVLPSELSTKVSVLNLAQNPLRALPAAMRDTSSLRFVSFERTLVTQAPQWIADAIAARGSKLVVAGFRSLLCNASSASSSAGSPQEEGVRCSEPSYRANGHYQLAHLSSFVDLPAGP